MLYTFTMQTKTLTHHIKRYLAIVGLYIAGPLFFITTDPKSLPLPLLVIPFLWIFAVLFVTTWIILSKKPDIHKKQVAMISGCVASIPVLLAVFQSIHQLSIRDVLLSVGLVVLAAIYMLRADFIK